MARENPPPAGIGSTGFHWRLLGEVMKHVARVAVVVSILLGGLAVAGESRTLTGEFVWSQRGRSGDLEAVFTPTGEGRWDVAFYFTFRGTPHTYSGTAEGSLSDGQLSGTVKNEGNNRTFTFRGAFEEGVFNGTHAEIGGSGPIDTGTLSLEE